MLQKLQDHINESLSFLKEKRLLLAVSGGIDSMVLLHLFHELKFEIVVAHCNFQLRGDESDDDEKFVKSQCEKLQIPIHINHFDTKGYAESKKLSIQIVARNLRYDWFETLLQNQNYDYLLTAHHLDDNIETFLINFTRGTGLEGLTGIPLQNGNRVRPLLCFSRNEIEDFARKQAISWREDSSNVSDKYVRNKIRHNIIPILKELNPSLLTSFEDTVLHLTQAQFLVADAAKMVFSEVVLEEENLKIDIPKLLKYPNYKAYLYQWLHGYGFSAWEDIYDLVNAQSGKQIFSETHALLKDRDHLILYNLTQSREEAVYFIEKHQKEVNLPLKITFCTVDSVTDVTTNIIFADANKLKFPLTLRRWQEGDVFYPFGMKGKKKLSKFFKDEKYSLLDKSNAWLLCSDNQIVWIVGKRQDDRFKITEFTTKILQINYTL